MPIPITLSPETKLQLLASIKRYVAEELDQDIGDLKAGSLLDYVIKEIGPTIYNKAIEDAQAYFQGRALDLESIYAQKEFGYWEAARQQQTKADKSRQRQKP